MEHVTARDSGAVVHLQALRRGRFGRLRAHHRARRRQRPRRAAFARSRRRHLPAHQVQALEPEHLHQPEADRLPGPAGQEGRRAGRRSLHRKRRTGARPQRAGGVHAVARLQLRRRHRGQREAGQGRLLHLDPHRGVRNRSPRHQARSGGDHARHSEHRRRRSCATWTRAASSASAPPSSRATSWSAR